MFSQHPDHASVPFWHKRPLIKTHDELKEAFTVLSELAAQEVMWDWEGKLVDDSVIERLVVKYPEFFAKNKIGHDVFITFRVPNPRVESGYRLGRAFMVILAAEDVMRKVGSNHRPLFEVILPMTETAAEMVSLKESFKRIAEATHISFAPNQNGGNMLEVIPIFESIGTILRSAQILKEYFTLTKEVFGETIPYFRPFLARSDPALNSGMVATTLAIKSALSDYVLLESEYGFPMLPIIAPGALPFRGGLIPETTGEFLDEFSGIKTLVIQSAFRYDFPLSQVKSALRTIQEKISQTKIRKLSVKEKRLVNALIPVFETNYKKTIELVAPPINALSKFVPQRRERMQHIGLFGYSRHVGKHSLPRAIGFTAGAYSLGLPPELFGLGEALQTVKKRGAWVDLQALYPGLGSAIKRSGRYVRRKSIQELGLVDLEKDLALVEKIMGFSLGPVADTEKEHEALVGQIIKLMQSGGNSQELIEQAAVLRKSIG